MAAKIVFSWRGRIRAQLKKAREAINALIAYNTKHPEVGFLTATTLAEVTTVQLLIGDRNTATSLLGAKKPR